MRAAATMSSAGTSVIAATLSTGYSLHALLELVEALHPLGDELLVVDAFVDDHVEHAERERAVGAGPQLQVMGRAAGHPGVARIDRDDLRAALHAVDDPVP